MAILTTFVFLILFKVFVVLCMVPRSFTMESNVPNLQEDIEPESNQQVTSFASTTESFLRDNGQLDVEVEERFHINTSTIIHTGESKILGAEYLDEKVLPTNHDCLIWCLETPDCNAVVFQEKLPGFCYMFNCGSPTSFLCKFTKYDFYTSSILKVHEKELAEQKTN